MKNNQGNIELLLLLCCLVGVVAFFSLSLAFSSVLLLEPQNKPDLLKKWQNLAKEKEEKEAEAQRLEEEKRELERQRKEKEYAPSDGNEISEVPREKMEDELRRLNEEYNRLIQRIEDLRKELVSLSTLPDPQKRQEKERELQELEKKLEELKKKIEEMEKKIGSLPPDGNTGSIEEGKLRKELEESQKKRRDLEKEVEGLKIGAVIGGISQFKNPLFVECKKDIYIFYPKKEAFTVMELDKRNIFKEKASGHDIIVLFVRPEGFESFKKAYTKVKAMSIALSYEPIEADRKLEFFKGINR